MMSKRKGVIFLAVAGLAGLPLVSYANRDTNRTDDAKSSSEGQHSKVDWKFDRADYYKDSDSPSFKYVDERSRSDTSTYNRMDRDDVREEGRERPTLNPDARSFNEKGSMRGEESEEYGTSARPGERSEDREHGSMERGMNDRGTMDRDRDMDKSGSFGARGSASGSGSAQGSGNVSGSGTFSGSGNVGGSGSFSGSGSAGASGGGSAGGK